MKVKRSRYSSVLNFISLILLLAAAFYLATHWQSIPDKIPGHYNASGAVDRWGNKGELLLLPVIGWILYFMITAAEHFPQFWNTGVQVTAQNKEQVFRILGNLIATVKLIMAAVFVFLTMNSAAARPLPGWFLPVVIIALIASTAFHLFKLIRAR